ncbi:DNA ligase [Desulfogranum marinum]|uniref:DNA ligase n=1 Tax=Desulfogranum marinum TaxID=453220 RepID=UPI0029C7D112|nr:DNA ligase [Desulfogranum marinum]
MMRKFTYWLLCCLFSCVLPAQAAELMLPQVYSSEIDISGWLMSEKYDGVRGYWDGHQLFSKNGKQFHPPLEFVQDLPPFPIEGELWGGRGTFEQTVSTVNKQYPHPGWLQLKFAIFDVPHPSHNFLDRIEKARQWFAQHPSGYAFVISQIPITDQVDMERELLRIEQLGGEGLIVRKPDGLYKTGRSTEILKVKNYQDAEATVVAYLPGKGKNEGRLGALLVELDDGTKFRIGSGFSDADRESPPPVGTVITFKFYGRYDSGIPKFPSYLRIRKDVEL